MFRVDDSITLKKDKDYGIDGSVITFQIIKSRTNISKRTVPLIFNKTEGYFDNELSLFQLLSSEGVVKGAGVKQYFEELPDITFSKKTFKEKLNESPELQKVFIQNAFNILKTYLSDTKIEKNADSTSNNIINMFNELAGNITEEDVA
jgi:hypothetical protein